MATKPLARPVTSSARAKVVSKIDRKVVTRKAVTHKATTRKAVTKAAKKVVKKAASKSVKKAVTTPAKLKVAKTKAAEPKKARAKAAPTTTKLSKTKKRASVSARKSTMDATLVRVEDTPVVIAVDDPVARDKVRRLTAVDRIDDPPPATGVVLVERVTRAVERELLQIEAIVGGHRVESGRRTEAERRARTLASLARTLREVKQLRAADEPQSDHSKRIAEDAGRPRDLDEFRRTLWKRLENVVRSGPPASVRYDEPG